MQWNLVIRMDRSQNFARRRVLVAVAALGLVSVSCYRGAFGQSGSGGDSGGGSGGSGSGGSGDSGAGPGPGPGPGAGLGRGRSKDGAAVYEEVTTETIAAIQSRLSELGHDPGPADGIFGPRTRAAVLAYQRGKGLPADGILSRSLAEMILKGS